MKKLIFLFWSKVGCKLFGHKVTSIKEKRVKSYPWNTKGTVFMTIGQHGKYRYLNHCYRCGRWNFNIKKGSL